jgi:hypothetical protein
VLEELRSAVEAIEAFAQGFEPRALDGPAAARLVKVAATGKHALSAIEALAARRVDETGAYKASGARSAGHWLAATTGVPVANAVRALNTVKDLDELSATNEAFRAGRISAEQAHEIAGAARKDPTAEAALVAAANGSLKGLKDRCREARARAVEDDAAWAKRLHESRSLRHWVDPDSAVCGMYRLAPDKGAELNAALDAETDLLFREARAEGRREKREAYAADALHALITRGPRKPTSATLVIDETSQRCELVGVGPIPVTTAQAMLTDAKIRVLPKNGQALPEHSSESRHIPPWLKAWLDATYPVCAALGCNVAYGLEYDHVVAKADGGLTEQENLWRLCRHHHRLKHEAGWRVVGTSHDWDLGPPDSPDDPDPP